MQVELCKLGVVFRQLCEQILEERSTVFKKKKKKNYTCKVFNNLTQGVTVFLDTVVTKHSCNETLFSSLPKTQL